MEPTALELYDGFKQPQHLQELLYQAQTFASLDHLPAPSCIPSHQSAAMEEYIVPPPVDPDVPQVTFDHAKPKRQRGYRTPQVRAFYLAFRPCLTKALGMRGLSGKGSKV